MTDTQILALLALCGFPILTGLLVWWAESGMSEEERRAASRGNGRRGLRRDDDLVDRTVQTAMRHHDSSSFDP